jgi:hypothetical protein
VLKGLGPEVDEMEFFLNQRKDYFPKEKNIYANG